MELEDGLRNRNIPNYVIGLRRWELPMLDLERFFNDTGIGKGELPVIARLEDCGPNDSFEVQVTRESCILCGSGIEGVRRAVYYLEDLLSGNGGPWLQPGTLRKKAWVRQRISRCFFGPIKRPPLQPG